MSVSSLSVPEFVARWQSAQLRERSGAHQHFIDLCRLLNQPTPAEADQQGTFYTFEKGVAKTNGRSGFADVWLRGHFAWEYKGPERDLSSAYRQLLTYREDLENPPLLVVSTFNEFQVHTNFTGTPKMVYPFTLADLASHAPIAGTNLTALDVLRAIFENPERLKPHQTTAQVTESAAAEFSHLATNLRERGVPADQAAHFLMRLLFCLFAEDIGLLPDRLFTRLVENTRIEASAFRPVAEMLFSAMANGGFFGAEHVPYFNGGLFADGDALDLTAGDLAILHRAALLDWANVEPAIFGTLFERSLDPTKRAQLGAHYTSKDDIMLIVEPVVMGPLRHEWAAVQSKAMEIVAKRDAAAPATRERHQRSLAQLLGSFSDRLASVRVLDPACGSGNFLYVALKQLLDLEKEVVTFALANRLSAFFPQVSPRQLHGIELNAYARELAQVVIWIGYIQWLHDNGFGMRSNPVLQPLEAIEHKDALVARTPDGAWFESEWPEADVIIGNPPFLGDKRMRGELGDEYVDELRTLYARQVPGGADLVTYWFMRSHKAIMVGRTKRAGLLATNSIRTGANRKVLDEICDTGGIFFAWSDRPWILDGAAVRVSIVGFDDGSQRDHLLDGVLAESINSDLTSRPDVTRASVLVENGGLCFLGVMKGGPFDISEIVALELLGLAINPNGRPNSDVVRPRLGGQDAVKRARTGWVIDFVDMPEEEAALYEGPFEYVRRHVKPIRDRNRDVRMRTKWWLHGRSRPALRKALGGLNRCIVTSEVSKHRIFIWMDTAIVPDHTLHVVAREDDYCFGVLQSRIHEIWTLAQCSWIGAGNDQRYSSSRTFETFPFPWAPGAEPEPDTRIAGIADAAKELVRRRDAYVEAEPRRTYTGLYNDRPTWLDIAHRRLDYAVMDAYGWPHDLSENQIIERLLVLNADRACASQGG